MLGDCIDRLSHCTGPIQPLMYMMGFPMKFQLSQSYPQKGLPSIHSRYKSAHASRLAVSPVCLRNSPRRDHQGCSCLQLRADDCLQYRVGEQTGTAVMFQESDIETTTVLV